MPKKKYSKRKVKSQSWRSLGKKSRYLRKLRLFSLAVVSLLSTLLVYSFINLWGYFIKPKAQASIANALPSSNLDYSGSSIIFTAKFIENSDDNILLDSCELINFDKSGEKISIYKIPYSHSVETKEFGNISISSVGKLFLSEDYKNAIKYLEDSFNLPIEGLIFYNSDTFTESFDSSEDLFELNGFYQAFVVNRQSVYTNISLKKLLDLAVFKQGVFRESVYYYDFDVSVPMVQKDNLLKESLRLEISNATSIPGLAFSEKEKLEAIGVKVVSVNNKTSEGTEKDNIIFLSSEKLADLKTVSYLKERYNAEVKYSENIKSPALLLLVNEEFNRY